MPKHATSSTGALLVSENIAKRYGSRLASMAPGLPLARLGPDGSSGAVDQIEIAFFSGDCYPELAPKFVAAALSSERLAWLHSFSAGVDNPVFQSLVDRGIRVSHSSGANAVAVAHCAMSGLMALARELPKRLDDQRAHRWERRISRDLEGATLAVVGLGPIGREIGRVGEALRMNVIGMRRRVLGDEPFETWELERLHELLRISDYLVLALPLVPDTHHLIHRGNLEQMKESAAIINIGRGELIDEVALIEALTNGTLRAAALDVFEEEPLPVSSELWDLPNVIVTPHCGGYTAASHENAVESFLENLVRYQAGQPLRNEIL